ncbi:MAG: glycosyltransferase family 2 protein [Betaproteobacteria bacterium]|nr:glycosyltransferase family 2 protein [Betaproteobacteria bacterium]
MLCKIILVNWKRAADTCACITSLERTIGIKWFAVICENGSPDGSATQLQDFLAKKYTERIRSPIVPQVFDYYAENAFAPHITLVLSPTNLGFAKGNNLAYHYAHADLKAEFVWFLNNDTEVEPDTLSRMIERMKQDPTIGICGSTIVYAHDRKTIQALGGAAYYPWSGIIREIGQGKTWPCTVNVSEIEARMHYVSGASMLVTNEFINRVGLMAEDYFLYYEEIDWAERARKAGFRLGYASQAVIFHKEGAALGSGKSTHRSMLSEYYGILGRLTVTRRFFPWALPSVYLFSLLQILRRYMQGYRTRARMMAEVLLGLRRTPPEE